MLLDFSTQGDESITYKAEYGSGSQSVQLDLDMTANIDDGIQSCAASYGSAGALCTCEVCADNFGVNVDCGGSATTDGCAAIDLQNFERFVPFFVTENSDVITRSVNDDSGTVGRPISSSASVLALVAAIAF
jgi:hypothetical protein